MEQNFENWEDIPSFPDAEAELKQIKKSLNKQKLKTILISLVSAAILVLVGLYGILPAVEKCYPTPYGDHLREMLIAYYELTNPGKTVSISYGKTGFAAYDLFLTRKDTTSGEKDILHGTLTRGTLELDIPFYDRELAEVYLWSGFDHPDDVWEHFREDTVTKLQELPEYITVEAVVLFPEDLTMSQVMELDYKYGLHRVNVNLHWLAVRCCDKDAENPLPTFGFSMSPNGSLDLNERYPDLCSYNTKIDGSHMAQHFKSLLQFSMDQVEKGLGIISRRGDESLYQTALTYVEENGVNTYGGLATGTPSGLLKLLEDGIIENLILTDAWIDVN